MKRKHPNVPLDEGDPDPPSETRASASHQSQEPLAAMLQETGPSTSAMLPLMGGIIASDQPPPVQVQVPAPAPNPLSWLDVTSDTARRPPTRREPSGGDMGFDLMPPMDQPGDTDQNRPMFDYGLGGPGDMLFQEADGTTGSSKAAWTPSTFDALLQQLGERRPSPGSIDTDPRPSTQGQPSIVSPPLYRVPSHTYDATANPLLDAALIRRGSDLFFTHSSRYFTFLHQHTFDPLDSAHPKTLIAGIMCTGLLFSCNATDRGRAKECYARGKALMVDDGAWKADMATSARALASLQALVLLSTFAIMGMGGEETQVGLRMHSKCVEVSHVSFALLSGAHVSLRGNVDWRSHITLHQPTQATWKTCGARLCEQSHIRGEGPQRGS